MQTLCTCPELAAFHTAKGLGFRLTFEQALSRAFVSAHHFCLPPIKIATMHRAGPPTSAMNTKKVLMSIVSSLLSMYVLYNQTDNPSTSRVIPRRPHTRSIGCQRSPRLDPQCRNGPILCPTNARDQCHLHRRPIQLLLQRTYHSPQIRTMTLP